MQNRPAPESGPASHTSALARAATTSPAGAVPVGTPGRIVGRLHQGNRARRVFSRTRNFHPPPEAGVLVHQERARGLCLQQFLTLALRAASAPPGPRGGTRTSDARERTPPPRTSFGWCTFGRSLRRPAPGGTHRTSVGPWRQLPRIQDEEGSLRCSANGRSASPPLSRGPRSATTPALLRGARSGPAPGCCSFLQSAPGRDGGLNGAVSSRDCPPCPSSGRPPRPAAPPASHPGATTSAPWCPVPGFPRSRAPRPPACRSAPSLASRTASQS